MRVADYSRSCLQQLRRDTGIEYEHRTGGTLQLFRTQAQLDAVQGDIAVLEECSVPYQLLTRDELAGVEPALAQARDETYKVAVTRFDNRIRVSDMAELDGFDLRLNPRRRETLELVVNDLFPGGDVANATFWTGLRPMTSDSTPIVGATRFPNLFLNTGHHGTLGWTMACGSGNLVADLVTGRRPEISTDGLAIDRYTIPRQRSTRLPAAAGA